MQPFRKWILTLVLLSVGGLQSAQAQFTDTNGVTYTDPFHFNDRGVIFRTDGKTSERIPYSQFTNEALKEFVKNPKARTFVEILLEPEPGEEGEDVAPVAQESLEPPKWQPVPDKPELPAQAGLIGGMFKSGPGWVIMLAVYGANIWAGFQIGMYRRKSKWLVPGVSAAVPIVGPIVFLCMKPDQKDKETVLPKDGEKEKEKKSAAQAVARPAAKGKAVVTARAAGGAPVSAAAAHGAAGAAAQPAPIAAPKAKALEPIAYVRGEVNFNKRFLETKFAPFFKLIPDEPYRSAWLWFNTGQGEFWVKRIIKVTQTDVTLQCPQENGGVLDETVQIAAIQEIHLRPGE